MKKNWTLFVTGKNIPSMPPGHEFSQMNELVNFNGVRVDKSTIPALVQFLVQCDPMTVPSGEELEPWSRESVSHLFRSSFQEGDAGPVILSALEGNSEALRYLTGLMASRV